MHIHIFNKVAVRKNYECQKYEKITDSCHENADANITCDFGDGDISRFSCRFPYTCMFVSSIIVRFCGLMRRPSSCVNKLRT